MNEPLHPSSELAVPPPPRRLIALLQRKEALLLLAAGIAIRVIALAAYHPVTMPDSRSYLRLAREIAAWNLSHDRGERTPLYPLVVALCQSIPSHVYLVQALIGLAISAMLYLYLGTLGARPIVAMVGGLIYSLGITSLTFEHEVMTETFTTFLVVGTLLASAVLLRAAPSTWRHWLLVGLLGGCASLVRSNYLLFALAVIAVLAIIVHHRRAVPNGRLAGLVLLGVLPALLLTGGWSGVNYARFHWFTPSTITGFALMDEGQHLILSPPPPPRQYRRLASAYIDTARLHPGGYITWTALPLAKQRTGESQVRISRDLIGLCTWLFVHHPVHYGKDIVLALLRFWTVPILGQLRATSPRGLPQLLLLVYQLLYLAAGLAFFLALAAVVLSGAFRRQGWSADLLVFLTAVVIIAVPTVLVDVGEPSRYKVPLEALIFAWLLVLGGTVLSAAFHRSPAASPLAEHPVVTT